MFLSQCVFFDEAREKQSIALYVKNPNTELQLSTLAQRIFAPRGNRAASEKRFRTERLSFALSSPRMGGMHYPPRRPAKDSRTLILATAVIVGLRLARDPRAGSKTERVLYALEDGLFLANEIYELAIVRFAGSGEYQW